MNRNKRTAIVLGIAVLMAAIASMGVYRIVSTMPARRPPPARWTPWWLRTRSSWALG